MDPLLAKYQCRFRKGMSAQNSLLVMLGNRATLLAKANYIVHFQWTFQKPFMVFDLN